jgi:hypothetical protein
MSNVLYGYSGAQKLVAERRAILPEHDELAFLKTLHYVQKYLKRAIYVVIADQRLALFRPFCMGSDFKNDFWQQLLIAQMPAANLPIDRWWANAKIISTNEQLGGWNTTFNLEIRQMLRACAVDLHGGPYEFWINKRDSSCVRIDSCHPYPHAFSVAAPVVSTSNMQPFFSFYTDNEHSDILFPLPIDYQMATGVRDRPDKSAIEFETSDWLSTKRPVLMFRGSLTHPARLALCKLAQKFTSLHGIYLDVGITASSKRYLLEDGVIRAPASVGLPLKPFVPMSVQAESRFIIYIDGHAAANRMCSLLLTGSCIIVLESLKCARTWLHAQMRPWIHYLPLISIKKLGSLLKWAAANPDACCSIAEAGYTLADHYNAGNIHRMCQHIIRSNVKATDGKQDGSATNAAPAKC